MHRELLVILRSAVLMSVALAIGCSPDNFPTTPTPQATSAVVLQGTRYQGSITLASGMVTSFNMTLLARGLLGEVSGRRTVQATGPLTVSGSFETGTGLTGSVQGALTGSLDNGFFNGSLIADATNRSEQQYSGQITAATAALAPGDCLQGSCAGDGLTGAIQTVQAPAAGQPPPPPCSYAITPTSASISNGGGPGSTNVAAGPDCAWSAIATAPWITIVGDASGRGPGTVAFTAQPNQGDQRSGMIKIADQTFTVMQSSGACSYTLTPPAQSVPTAGGPFSTAVTTTCAWTASSDAPWITIGAGGSGTTSGTITYTVAATSDTAVRTGRITVQGPGGTATLTVTQAGTACWYTLNPNAPSVPAGGGSVTTALTTSCAWATSIDVPWLTISQASGAGNATLTIVAQPNTEASARTGRVIFQGPGGSATVTVTQAPPTPECIYTLAPASQTVGAAGGSSSTVFTRTAACTGTWTATPDMTWITITAPSSGTAGATITYAVASNPGAPRTGHITVTGPGGSATLMVNQDGLPCSYTLAPASTTVAAAGASLNTVFTRTAACTGTWTATSDVPWITNITPNSGTAGATIGYVVASNSGAQRTGQITVSGPGGSATLTVTQDAACTYTLVPAAVTVPSNGGTFSTVFTRGATCNGTWLATSDVVWITNISPGTGTASATISYRVEANTGSQRVGHLNVVGPGGGSASLTVTQQPLIIGVAGLARRWFSLLPDPGRPDPRTEGQAVSFISTGGGTGDASSTPVLPLQAILEAKGRPEAHLRMTWRPTEGEVRIPLHLQ